MRQCSILTTMLAVMSLCALGAPVAHGVAEPRCTHNPKAIRTGSIRKPVAVHQTKPDFRGMKPAAGSVFVEIDIDESGQVTQACVVKGLRPDIDAAVMRALRRWRFSPARLRSGEAVPVIQAIAIPVEIR